MTSYNKFDSNVYSEESFPVTENEYDEAMKEMAEDEGYYTDSRFYFDEDGKVHEVAEPPSIGRIGGFEL